MNTNTPTTIPKVLNALLLTDDMIQESTNNPVCCAGNATGDDDDPKSPRGRYCVPADKWGPLSHDMLNTSSPSLQAIFVASGPGGDFAIKNSGTNCKPHPNTNILFDLVTGYVSAYGKDWKMPQGNSLALYG